MKGARLLLACVSLIAVLGSRVDAGEITITSFLAGGQASHSNIDATGLDIGGFGVGGSNYSFWGTLEDLSGIGLAFGPTSGGFSRTDFLSATGVYRPQAGMHQAMTFDATGRPVITYTSRASATMNLVSGNTANVVKYNPTSGQFETSLHASDVGIPRHSAVAVGGGSVAVYSGSDTGGPGNPAYPGPKPETLVRNTSGLDRHSLGVNSNYPGPLEFDTQGVLHQAIVEDVTGGRDLHYFSRSVGGLWTDSIIDNGFRMTGHIDLELKSDGTPVIIGNSAGDGSNDRTLSIHERTDAGWQETGISLNPLFGTSLSAAWQKQIVFDLDGRAHVAMFDGDTNKVGYLALNADWSVAEKRVFSASAFYGLGVDSSGEVFLGYVGEDGGGGNNDTVPEPATFAIFGLGALCLVAGGIRRRRRVS